MSDPRAVVMDWLDGLWVRRDEGVIDRLRGDASRSSGLDRGELVGRDGFRAFYRRFNRMFDGVAFDIQRWVVDGDDVAVHVVFMLKRGEKVARVDGAAFATVVEGRIVAAHNVWNLGEAGRVFGAPHAEGFDDLLTALEAQPR